MTGPYEPPQDDDANAGSAQPPGGPQYNPPPAGGPVFQPGYNPGYQPAQPPPGQPVPGQPIQGQPIQGQPIQGQPIQGQPGPGYGYQPGYPAQPAPQPAPRSGGAALAERAQRFAARPQPTSGSTFAGVGIGLLVFGVIIWAGGYAVSGATSSFSSGGGGSSSHTWLGIVLSLAVTALGYAIAAIVRRGPLATAGVAASALGIPTALVFITLDFTGGSPINVDAVFIVSIVVWLLSYAVVPGVRGHGFYLGLGALALWVYLIIKISPSLPALPAEFALRSIGGSFGGPHPSDDLGSLTAMSFVLAAALYAIAFLLDRSGHRGVATPLVAAGFPVLVGAFLFASKDFGQTGEGITLIIVGFALVFCGARAQRRFTTWAWGFAILLGVVLLIQKASPDNDTAAGLLFILCGLILVGAGVIVSSALGEREYPEA